MESKDTCPIVIGSNGCPIVIGSLTTSRSVYRCVQCLYESVTKNRWSHLESFWSLPDQFRDFSRILDSWKKLSEKISSPKSVWCSRWSFLKMGEGARNWTKFITFRRHKRLTGFSLSTHLKVVWCIWKCYKLIRNMISDRFYVAEVFITPSEHWDTAFSILEVESF